VLFRSIGSLNGLHKYMNVIKVGTKYFLNGKEVSKEKIITYLPNFDILKNNGNVVVAGNVQGGWSNSNVSVYSVKIYNRALSAQEVLQNYNALKPRFNLK